MTGLVVSELLKYLTLIVGSGAVMCDLFWLGWPFNSACALRFFSDMIQFSARQMLLQCAPECGIEKKLEKSLEKAWDRNDRVGLKS
jgi:hypothetical protein